MGDTVARPKAVEDLPATGISKRCSVTKIILIIKTCGLGWDMT
jgi:hypothetical protein